MSAIRPNKEQFVELIHTPDEGPVVMLNLLKFKAKADDGQSSGQEEYNRYGDSVVKMVEARGGKVLWLGKAEQVLIGDANEPWDAVALVEYPNRKAFIDMTTSKEYDAAHEHRESGLERTMLIACSERARAQGI